jgi:pre-mRNA-splicing factor ISY1
LLRAGEFPFNGILKLSLRYARDDEKAQSVPYRFREAQTAELGLGTRSGRRSRTAIACNGLRECERWLGEISARNQYELESFQDASLYVIFVLSL